MLASGALVAGATYAFRLEATLAGRAAVGAASVSFYVARPPSSGKLYSIFESGGPRLHHQAEHDHAMGRVE